MSEDFEEPAKEPVKEVNPSDQLITKRAAAIEVIKEKADKLLMIRSAILASFIIGVASFFGIAATFGVVLIAGIWFIYNMAKVDKQLKYLKEKYGFN